MSISTLVNSPQNRKNQAKKALDLTAAQVPKNRKVYLLRVKGQTVRVIIENNSKRVRGNSGTNNLFLRQISQGPRVEMIIEYNGQDVLGLYHWIVEQIEDYQF